MRVPVVMPVYCLCVLCFCVFALFSVFCFPCSVFRVPCPMSRVKCDVSCVMCHVTCITHASCVKRHSSCVTFHVSCILHHASCIICPVRVYKHTCVNVCAAYYWLQHILSFSVTIGNEYSIELWDYLISHNQMSLLETWIENVTSSVQISCNQIFPSLPEEMPMEFITTHMKETLLHLLVKNGYYPQCIIQDFSGLIRYFGAAKILFSDVHPMIYYKKNISDEDRNELVNKFNNDFVCFCQEQDLIMVLWHYISHYRYGYFDFIYLFIFI